MRTCFKRTQNLINQAMALGDFSPNSDREIYYAEDGEVNVKVLIRKHARSTIFSIGSERTSRRAAERFLQRQASSINAPGIFWPEHKCYHCGGDCAGPDMERCRHMHALARAPAAPKIKADGCDWLHDYGNSPTYID